MKQEELRPLSHRFKLKASQGRKAFNADPVSRGHTSRSVQQVSSSDLVVTDQYVEYLKRNGGKRRSDFKVESSVTFSLKDVSSCSLA